jgi:uncharacterized phage protein gp47/JayE
MTTFGLTNRGFSRKRVEDISNALKEKFRNNIAKTLVFSERTKIGNIVSVFSDEFAQVWEILEAAYYAHDPDQADEESFEGLCALTGVIRNGAQKGLVECTLVVGASFDAAPGVLVAHVLNQPTNRWVNRDQVTSVSGGTISAMFESEKAASTAVAPSGRLTVIAQSVSGWTSITNSLDAIPGQDVERIDALRVRREASLAASGSATLGAIIAKVAQITDMIAVTGRENVGNTYQLGLPPGAFEIVVFDGVDPAVSDDDIAQVIYDSKPAGQRPWGSSSGNAEGVDGSTVEVCFTRANILEISIQANVWGNFDPDVLKESLVAFYAPAFRQSIILERLRAECFKTPGVTDVPTAGFLIGVTGLPLADANVIPSFGQIAVLDTSRIQLT